MLSFLVSSCTDDDFADNHQPLQVSVTANSPLVSRAIVTDEYLPDGSTIGVSLLAADGSSYDGQNYSNVKYTAAGTGDAQTWTGAADVSLSGNPATVVAYYPWQEGADLTAVSVETATQTDYMWAETLTGVANTNPGVKLVMNHALTAVRVRLVLGDYTGSADVSNVSVASPALGTAASLDVLGGEGALGDITGQGDAVELDVDFGLTAEGTSTDVMLVPDESITSGKTVVTATIGGKKFAANIAFDEAYKQGYVYTYVIKLNNTGFEVIKVAVTPWEDGGLKEAEFELEKDNAYVVKIVAEYVAAGPLSLIEDEEVAYNNNTFAVQSRSGETFEFEHNIKGFVGNIDWGDGTTTTYDVATDWPSHEYPNDAAEYIITAKGTMTVLDATRTFNKCLKEVIHIGECGIIDMTGAFYGCESLQAIPEELFDKCTKVISFKDAFRGCTNLQNIPEGLFDKCTEVTSFESAFMDCISLTSIPAGLFDYCTKVKDFYYCFSGTGITSIPEGLFKNCTEVTDFEGTFYGCESLTEITAGLFDNCTKVTSFLRTFAGCDALQTIPEGFFENCTKVTSFQQTFMGCANIQTIPQGLFDHCTKVTDFDWTFCGCRALIGESPYTLVDGVKVHLYERSNYPEYFTAPTSSYRAFYNCTGLTDYANIPEDWI